MEIELTIKIDDKLLDNYVSDQNPFSMRRKDMYPVLDAVLAACKEQSVLFHACPECGEPVHDNKGQHMIKKDGTFCFAYQFDMTGYPEVIGPIFWNDSIGHTMESEFE